MDIDDLLQSDRARDIFGDALTQMPAADQSRYELLCVAYANALDRYLSIAEELSQTPTVTELTNAKGKTNRVVNPLITAQRAQFEVVYKLATQLRLTRKTKDSEGNEVDLSGLSIE